MHDVQVLEQTPEWTNGVEVCRGRRRDLSFETVHLLGNDQPHNQVRQKDAMSSLA